jgi:putative SOS response-associated peptidase YedK
MCGRYRLKRTWREIYELYMLTSQPARNVPARYNIAPTQNVLAVRLDEAGNRLAADLRWGLIPSWAKDTKIMQINARSETVSEKPMFRGAFKSRRCLVIADGYYEWQTIGEGKGAEKLPWLFEIGEGELFAFAGIWERWEKGPDGPVESCALMTTEPNPLCATVHDRMPVILDATEIDTWLSPKTPADELAKLLDSYPEERMSKRRVGKKLNSARFDGPELEAPV